MPLATARRAHSIAVLALVCSAVGLVAGGVTRGVAIRNNCQQIQSVKTYIHDAIDRSENTLPTLQYYKDHPAELDIALKANEELKMKMVPQACPQWYQIWKS